MIADPERFALTAEAEDPFRPVAPLDAAGSSTTARGRCGPLDVKPELIGDQRSFSITTLFCSWGTAETRALAPVAEGDPLTVRVWHFSQIKLEAAEAHLLLAKDDRVFWRATVPLPSEGRLLSDELPAPFAIAAGDRLLWHVENHGQNSWNFIALETTRPCAN